MESYQQEWIAGRRAYLRKKHYIQSRPNFVDIYFKKYNYSLEDHLSNPNLSLSVLKQYVETNKRKILHDTELEDSISSNPNITLKFVKQHRYIHFNWSLLSENMIISMDEVMNNLHLPWDFKGLCNNPWISYYDIEKYSVLQNWKELSRRLNLPTEFVVKYKCKSWDIGCFIVCSCDGALSTKLLDMPEWLGINLYQRLADHHLHIHATESDILNNPNLKWEYHRIIKDPKYSLEFCKQMCDTHVAGDYYCLITNPAITAEFIEKYDLLKNIHTLANDAMPDVDPEFIIKHANVNSLQLGEYLSEHPKVTARFVLDHLEILWNWRSLAGFHANITADDIIQHRQLPWFGYLSLNKYLRPEHFEEANLDGLFYRNESYAQLLWAHPKYYNTAIARDIIARQTRLRDVIDESFPIAIAIAVIEYIDYA